MSNQVWSDLLLGTGRQLWGDIDSAPGIITPAPAALTLFGRGPAAAQQIGVFRTPAPATLTLSGLSLAAPVVLTPAPAALAYVGQIPARQLIRTITPSLAAPIETPQVDPVPTLITIWTTQPGVGQVVLRALELNITQGGNIGFVSPAPAQLGLLTQQYSLLLLSGGAGLGAIQLIGLAPTLQYELTITPNVGQVTCGGLLPELGHPFIWVDDTPAPTVSWITDAAA